MGKVIPGLVDVLIVVSSLLFLTIPPGSAQTLSIDAQQGEPGRTLPFTVWLDKAPKAIDAFGFEVFYDHNILQYTGRFTPETLSRGFDFFDVHEPQAGRLKVGGFTTKNHIHPGDSGRLVTLEFTILGAGSTALGLVNLVDDLAGWHAQAGHFEATGAATSSADNSSAASSQTPSTESPHSSTAPATSISVLHDTQTLSREETSAQSTSHTTGTPAPSPWPSTSMLPGETRHGADPDIPRQAAVGGRAHSVSNPKPTRESSPVGSSAPKSSGQTAGNTVHAQPQQRTQNVSSQPLHPKADRAEPAQPIVVYANSTTLNTVNTLLSSAAFLGVIVIVLLQRKELKLQRKALHILTHECKQIVYTHNKTAQKFHEQTYDIVLSAKLNALNTMIKVAQQKMQLHVIHIGADEPSESHMHDEYLETLERYASTLEQMLEIVPTKERTNVPW